MDGWADGCVCAATLPCGASFGEAALVNAHGARSVSVVAARGVDLAVLHRGAVNTLRFLAETQASSQRTTCTLHRAA